MISCFLTNTTVLVLLLYNLELPYQFVGGTFGTNNKDGDYAGLLLFV